MSEEKSRSGVLRDLMETIHARRRASPDKSYVAKLFSEGPRRIRGKIEEEAEELVTAVEEATGDRRDALIHESADLLFHSLVLIGWAGISLNEVEEELARRLGTSGLKEQATRPSRSL